MRDVSADAHSEEQDTVGEGELLQCGRSQTALASLSVLTATKTRTTRSGVTLRNLTLLYSSGWLVGRSDSSPLPPSLPHTLALRLSTSLPLSFFPSSFLFLLSSRYRSASHRRTGFERSTIPEHSTAGLQNKSVATSLLGKRSK